MSEPLLKEQIRAPGFFSAQAIGSEDTAATTRGKHLAFSLAASVDWAPTSKDNEVRRVAVSAQTVLMQQDSSSHLLISSPQAPHSNLSIHPILSLPSPPHPKLLTPTLFHPNLFLNSPPHPNLSLTPTQP